MIGMYSGLVLTLIFFSSTAWAASDTLLEPVLLGLVAILASAKIGAYLASRLGQSVVLGELLSGIFLGNLVAFGFNGLEFLRTSEIFQVLAGLGAVLMLFEVGLESDLRTMLKAGKHALMVAVVGIVLPCIFGFLVSKAVAPSQPFEMHLFMGAVLSATSIGITAKVLKDLGQIKSNEGRVILGAAVIDDVLALILLAAVSGMVTQLGIKGPEGDITRSFDYFGLFIVTLKAFGFLGITLFLGVRVAPMFFRFGARLKGEGALFILSMLLCFGLAWAASLFGLAPIIGAFAAGLLIDGTGFERFFNYDPHQQKLESALFPLSKLMCPIFFVMMGFQVDLRMLSGPEVWFFGIALTLAAILGKVLSAFVLSAKDFNRWAVGFGMVPRGEVGLIFASVGLGLKVSGEPLISASSYAAIVFMVIFTTVAAPPLLVWSFKAKR